MENIIYIFPALQARRESCPRVQTMCLHTRGPEATKYSHHARWRVPESATRTTTCLYSTQPPNRSHWQLLSYTPFFLAQQFTPTQWWNGRGSRSSSSSLPGAHKICGTPGNGDLILINQHKARFEPNGCRGSILLKVITFHDALLYLLVTSSSRPVYLPEGGYASKSHWPINDGPLLRLLLPSLGSSAICPHGDTEL